MPASRKPAGKATPARHTAAKPAVKGSGVRTPAKTPTKPAAKRATDSGVKPATKAAPRTTNQPGRGLLPVAKISKPAAKPVGNPQSIVTLAKKVRLDLGDTEVNVLAVPYEARQLAVHFGAKWHKELRCHIYPGPILPPELAFYASEPYSWERWIEDQINGKIKPIPGAPKPMVPRPHQQVAIDKIRSIGTRGGRGFIEADATGVGKSLTSLLGVSAVASMRGHTRRNPGKLLIMCPKSVIPHWRNTIRAAGVDNLRVTIINYDQALKLVTQPEIAQKAKTQRTAHTRQINNGMPNVKWDLVILDEVHKCFPYETLIETDRGIFPIGQIVEKKMSVKVLSRNDITGELSYQPIKKYMASMVESNDLVTLNHQYGKLTTTKNHPIWIKDQGYIAAEEIARVNEKSRQKSMRSVQRNISARRKANSQKQKVLFGKMLPGVIGRLHRLPLRKAVSADSGNQTKILQQKMLHRFDGSFKLWTKNQQRPTKRTHEHNLRTVQKTFHSLLGKSSKQKILLNKVLSRESSTPYLKKDERTKSHVQGRKPGKNDRIETAANFSFSGRKRPTYQTPASFARAYSTADGSGNPNKQEMGGRKRYSKSASLLQGGFGTHRVKNIYRGRRQEPSDQTLEILGRAENTYLKPSRVVSYTIHERGSVRESRGSGKPDIEVYNFEVAKNSNYFAEGVLVHNCKNDSQRSKAVDVITRAGNAAADAPFVVYASATIGQTPLELRYLASLVAQLTGRKTLTGKTWGAWLETQGFAVKKSKSGEYSWVSQRANTGEAETERVAGLQQRDTQRIAELLFGPDAPSIRRAPTDIAGWPEIQRIPYPVALQPAGMGLYRQLWESFRQELRLLPRGHNPKAGVVIQLRFRQKASLLLINDTFEQIEDLLENGYQVAVSVQFMESIDLLREKLRGAGIASEEFSGRQGGVEREAARLRFQRGEVPVIFFTVTEGISLHAGEALPDGSTASMTPRATIVHDIFYSSISCLQVEGRAHRDGQKANVYYMYAENTVQEPILALMFKRMINMHRMSGEALMEKTDEQEELNAILESWN